MRNNKGVIIGALMLYLVTGVSVTWAGELPEEVQRKLRVSYIAFRDVALAAQRSLMCADAKKQVLALQNVIDVFSEIYVPAVEKALQHKHIVAPLSADERNELDSSLSRCHTNAPELVRFRELTAQRIRTHSSQEAESQKITREWEQAGGLFNETVNNLIEKIDILAHKHGGRNRFFFGPKLDS